MAVNEAIAQRLEDISRMLEVLGEDAFRAIANAKAARIIAAYPVDLASLAPDKKKLMEIEGIGPKIADKIIEFCATGSIEEHEALTKKVPAGVLALMTIPGLGPKTARVLWTEGHIDTIAKLEKAIADGSILKLPRMGEKSVEKIKESIALAKTAGQRMRLGPAQHVADLFVARLAKSPHVAEVAFAGSLRRGKETIGDIDVLVAVKPGHEKHAEEVFALFRETPGVIKVLSSGESKASVQFALPGGEDRWTLEGQHGDGKSGPSVQVDLRVLPKSSWGAALLYFTGSKEHNIRLRSRALEMGFTLNDWGLFPLQKGASAEERSAPHLRGVKPAAGATEAEVYAALDLEWIAPELREDHGEIAAAERAARGEKPGLPALIEAGDVVAELHAHTTASDGALSIDELVEEAIRRGFHTIAVTDHSKSSIQANGLSVDRLLAHVEAVHEAGARFAKEGIRVLAGSEVDILADGSLDYEDKVLAKLDVVVASPHTALSQDPDVCTKRLLKAMAHPRVHILGHPTGRLINRRKGLEPDLAALIAAAREHEVAFEVNAHWMRLDLRDAHVRLAVEGGCLVAIDCDVHERGDYDNLRFGVATARRGWCPRASVINTWPAKKLHEWLGIRSR